MKKLFYIAGLLSSMSLFIGIFFKFMHLPGATMLTFVGSTFLGLLFIPIKMSNHFKSHSDLNLSHKLMWYLGCFGFIIFITSSWFKLYQLQGATVLLGLSFVLLVLGFLPLLFLDLYKK